MHEPEFPVFVRIADERSMYRASSNSDLLWFEQIDLEAEGEYLAWDSVGREYRLVWNSDKRRPELRLHSAEGLRSFTREALDYSIGLYDNEVRRLPGYLCHPSIVFDTLSRIWRSRI